MFVVTMKYTYNVIACIRYFTGIIQTIIYQYSLSIKFTYILPNVFYIMRHILWNTKLKVVLQYRMSL